MFIYILNLTNIWHLLANGHLPRMSGQSRLLVNSNGDNERKQRAVHRSPGKNIYLTAEEILIKLQLEDSLVKAEQLVTTSNGIPYLQMAFLGSPSISRRPIEGQKEEIPNKY